MSSAQFSPLKQALTWSQEDELLSKDQLGLVEVSECAPATNGSATSRFNALAQAVPAPGVTSEVLDQALHVIRDTLTHKIGEGDEAKLVTIPDAKYLVSFTVKPSAPEAQGIINALMEKAKFAPQELRNKAKSADQFVSLIEQVAITLFFQHVSTLQHVMASAMADMVHIRRIQTVSEYDITPVKHLCALLKVHSIVAAALLRATHSDIGVCFVAASVAEHFLRRAVGASTTDGDAWVEERIAKKDIAKPTTQTAYVSLVSKYLEAMKANPGNSGDDKEADRDDLPPLDLHSLWQTPMHPKHRSPNKPAPRQPERDEEAHRVSDNSDSDDDKELSLNGVSPGAMDQNPDLHATWVGLKVVYVDSADASPVLGVVKKSKKQNQQASFKLMLDDGSTVWLNARNTAGAALARQEFDEAQKALGFPTTEDVVTEANKGAGAAGINSRVSDTLPDLRQEMKKLSKAGLATLDAYTGFIDEQYLHDEASQFASLFACDQGASFSLVRSAASKESVGSISESTLLSSAYFQGHTARIQAILEDEYAFTCSAALILWVAYATPKFSSFSMLIPSADNSEHDWGVDHDDETDIVLQAGGGFGIRKRVKDLRAAKALSTASMSETAAKLFCRILVEWHGLKMARFTTAVMQVFNKIRVQTDSSVRALNALLGQVYTAFTLSVTKCIRLSCRKTAGAPYGFALHSVADSQFSILPEGYMQDAGSKLIITSQSKALKVALNETKTESLFLRQQAVVMEQRVAALQAQVGKRHASAPGPAPTLSKKTRRAASKSTRQQRTPAGPPSPAPSPAPTPQFAPAPAPAPKGSVFKGGQGSRLKNATQVADAVKKAGFQTLIEAQKDFRTKNPGKLCFWLHSDIGKLEPGCPYTGQCNYEPPGH